MPLRFVPERPHVWQRFISDPETGIWEGTILVGLSANRKLCQTPKHENTPVKVFDWWRRVDSNHGPTDNEATIVALKLYMQSLARQNAVEKGRARNLDATRSRTKPSSVGPSSNTESDASAIATSGPSSS